MFNNRFRDILINCYAIDRFFVEVVYDGKLNVITVPEGKFWTFSNLGSASASLIWALPDETTSTPNMEAERRMTDGKSFLLGGYKLFKFYSPLNTNYTVYIYEHNLSTGTGLSSTNVELPNQIRLFPNPTTSEVALNSDKQYDIEVYDMAGNKIMELTGNTIDMSHLSSATYTVKAFDKIEQEHLSYKVIKK